MGNKINEETTSTECYLTDACINHFGSMVNTDRRELLLWFKNELLLSKDRKHYEILAPIIAEAIESEICNDNIYEFIYERVMIGLSDMLNEGDYDDAYRSYKSIFEALEYEYAKPFLQKKLIRTLKNVKQK